MTEYEIDKMAEEAGLTRDGDMWFSNGINDMDVKHEHLAKFAILVAAHEREKVAQWIIDKGYATGHGDTIIDLLIELDWQVREACAKVAEGPAGIDDEEAYWGREIAKAIRARGKS